MSQDSEPSVCDIFKDNSSKIINKLEMQTPSHFQIYSDMYKEYLHMLDDVFGTCIISEKEFFDKINADENSMKHIKSFSDSMTDFWIKQIENYDNYLKWYYQMRISGMKSYDQFVHIMMNSYSKTLSNFTKSLED